MRYRITPKQYSDEKEVTLFDTEAPNLEARLALAFLEKWGPVMAESDGEDSAGRQKLRPMPVGALVQRAFDIAGEAMRIARERGLMVNLPDLNELNREYDLVGQEEEKRKADVRSQKLLQSALDVVSKNENVSQ